MIEVFAPAKVNLALHVTGKRDDGYHLLESLVVFARDVGDVVRVAPSDEMRLTVDGPFADGVPTDDSNLVLRAAKALNRSKTAYITVTKNLPHGGGIGGGSADAAATLKALSQLWDVPMIGTEDVLRLGADVPVCLAGPDPQFLSGIGEIISPAPPLPKLWMVLINPGIHANTGDIFKTLSEDYGTDGVGLEPLVEKPDMDDFLIWLAGCHNDLTKCTAEFVPEVPEILERLWPMRSCEDADMSGSGSTCRGIFETEAAAREAAVELRQFWPDWWIKVSAIV